MTVSISLDLRKSFKSLLPKVKVIHGKLSEDSFLFGM